MAQIEEAAKRLQAALDSLERMVESQGAGDDGLRAALESARQKNEALQDAASSVAKRLDKTIKRLKATLEA